MKHLLRFRWGFVENVLETLGGILIFLMMIAVMIDVVFRYFLNSPVPNVPEMTAALLPVIAFIGMSAVAARGGHVRVTFLIERFSPGVRRGLYILATVLTLAATAFVVWRGWLVTWKSLLSFETRDAYVPFVLWPFRLAIPLGCAVLFVRLLLQLWGALHGSKESVRVEEQLE